MTVTAPDYHYTSTDMISNPHSADLPHLHSQVHLRVSRLLSYFDLQWHDLTNRGKANGLPAVRQMAAIIFKKHGNYSLVDIGKFLNRDHTTIMHSLDLEPTLRKEYPIIFETIIDSNHDNI